MIDLQKIIDGFFIEKDITHERLYNFSIDNIQKMVNNNAGGIYDDNIANTKAAAENFQTAMSKTTGDTGTRIGGTTAKDLQRTAIEEYLAIQILNAAVVFNGKKTANYMETYPNGMDSFYSVSKETFATNVEALIKKANKFETILGTTFKTTITAMYSTYSTADDNQVDATADVSDDIKDENTAAIALADQLTDNLFDIARNNRRSTTAITTFFTLSLLYPQHRKQIKKGKPEKHSETEVCTIEYSAGKRTHIHNTGAAKLTFGMKLGGLKVGATITLLPDEKANEPFSFYFTNGDSLYVVNNEDVPGMYQLDIVA